MFAAPCQRPALVSPASATPVDPGLYLRLQASAPAAWIEDPASATTFDSMREATRAALRLPGAFRAFAVPMISPLAQPAGRGDLH